MTLTIEEVKERLAEHDAAKAAYNELNAEVDGRTGRVSLEQWEAGMTRYTVSLKKLGGEQFARLATELYAELELERAENNRLKAALTELVELKTLKDRLGHSEFEEYKRRQPLAWQAARVALAETQEAK